MTGQEIEIVRNKLQVLCGLADYLTSVSPSEWDEIFIKKHATVCVKSVDDISKILTLTEKTI